MTAASRNTLAAALTLGAAVFAWPVQALQCLEPIYVGAKRPPEVAVPAMRRYAAEEIAKAGLIFKGRVISARHLPSNDPFEAKLLVTYKVVEWKKGSGRPYAKFVYLPWCDGKCQVRNIIKELLNDREERFHIIASRELRPSDGAAMRRKGLDGYMGPCEGAFSKRPLNAPYPNHRYGETFGQFLYNLAMAAELEELPSKKP